MAGKSNIEWCTDTWNPIRGCSRVSAGCQRCYAERQAIRQIGGAYAGLIKRTSHGPAWTGEIRTVPDLLDQPLRWAKPRRVFVNSMSDLFHESVPFEFIAAVFSIMAVTTRHTYQVLTKRPERMRSFFDWVLDGRSANSFDADERIMKHWPPAIPWKASGKNAGAGYDNCGPAFPFENVWLGVSVEDQATADERIPLLLQTPAAVRFVSYEPALGPVDFSRWMRGHDADRGTCLSGGPLGRASDRSGRNDLEARGSQSGPLEGRIAHDPVRTTPSRERDGIGLPAGARDDGRQAASCASAPTCVSTLQGANPCRTDDQSYQRQALGQSSGEPRNSHELGAEAARHKGARAASGTELPALSWVIVGGESGPKARPCDIGWIRSTVEQCEAASVPVFVKQLGPRVTGQIQHPDNEGRGVIAARLADRKGGDMAEWPEALRVREFPR